MFLDKKANVPYLYIYMHTNIMQRLLLQAFWCVNGC